MKKKYFLALLISTMFIAQIAVTAESNPSIKSCSIGSKLLLGNDVLNLPDWKVDYINARSEITYYNEEEVIEGYTMFNVDWDGRANSSIVIVDLDGNIVAGFNDFRGGPELINSTTVMFTNDTHVVFWNLANNAVEYIEMPLLDILNQHHDIEYNTLTDQFLILGNELVGTVDIGGEDFPIKHDTITLVDRNNNTIWHWRGYEHIPFDQDYYYLTNLSKRGVADWTHCNTIFWDMEESNIVYLNARHQSNVYKIDMTTGDILWTMGPYNGDFTIYDKYGNEQIALSYGSHSIERIGPNKFIIYDNDYLNLTDYLSLYPRYVEFEIDETTMTANETWTWEVPNNELYIGDHWGDVDLLPGNTRIGTFGAGVSTDNDYITEVNEAGEIVWEIAINGTDTYRAERFYASPLIKVDAATLNSTKRDNAIINVTVWNSFRERMSSDGKLSVYDGETLLLDYNFTFLPYWQDTKLSLEIPTEKYKVDIYNLTIVIENADGISTSIFVDLNVVKASAAGWIIGFSSLLIVAVVFRKHKK